MQSAEARPEEVPSNTNAKARPKLGLRVVCISDTHGCHRSIKDVPEGDLLIHAGDFTHFGKERDIRDLNTWLGELPHTHKVVVFGNHEQNAPWNSQAASLLSNATFLLHERAELSFPAPSSGGNKVVHIFGSRFYWPCRYQSGNTDLAAMLPPELRGQKEEDDDAKQKGEQQVVDWVDIVVSHGPANGFVDGGLGCSSLTTYVQKAAPRLVVSGHIHSAHGTVYDPAHDITFVNAAICNHGYTAYWQPVVVDI
ncbi:Metallophosphatase domain-containing protein [Balamuthia mandrillaris]